MINVRDIAAGATLTLFLMLLTAQAQEDKFPKNKWFDGVKGLNEALEIQKQTGADLFVYFRRSSPTDEAGLCSWFDKRGLGQPGVNKYLQDYIKVRIIMPLNRDDTQAVEKFNVNKCPAVFIVQTDGRHYRCGVFDWPGNKPKLREPNELIALFREKSGTRYQLGGAGAPVQNAGTPQAPIVTH